MNLYVVSGNTKRKTAGEIEETNEFTKFTGLMFRKSFFKPLLFKGNGRISIHSFFCFTPFDAVFLDNSRRIVKLAEMQPWQSASSRAFFLFEMPAGSIQRFNLKKGDKLQWKQK